MELNKLYKKLLWEQQIEDLGAQLDNDNEDNDNPEPNNNDNDFDPNDRPEFNDNQEPKYTSPYNTSQYKQIKSKWLTQHPEIDEETIDSYISEFNQRKNNFRPYRENYRAENAIMRNVPNMPEVVSLKQRFPNYPSEDIQKLKDIGSYTWDEIEFFIDRFITEDNMQQITFNVVGDTPQIRLEYAYQFWLKNSPTKIINENGLIVHKISGRDESIAYGQLQNMLVNKYGGADWCITSSSPTSTMYNSYRNRRSYYFVLRIGDKNTDKERDKYYISCLQPSTLNNEGPYVITPRENGDETRKTWDDVLNIYPQLTGKEHLFKYEPKTKKELFNESLDKIRFNDDPNDIYNFNNIKRSIQNQYIQSGKNIQSLNAILTLNKEQLNSYVRGITLANYRERFKSQNGNNPFEIIDFFEIDKPSLYRDINNIIIDQLKIPDGINAIKEYILHTDYTTKMYDNKNPDHILIVNRKINNVGIYDKKNKKFIKPSGYKNISTKIFSRTKPGTNLSDTFFISRYAISDKYINLYGDDYFYTICNSENFSIIGNEEFKGMFLTKEYNNLQQGDKLWDAAIDKTKNHR